MALYVTRPRRDEERIGRGLPSDINQQTAVNLNLTYRHDNFKTWLKFNDVLVKLI